jgi:hypothetical protein
MENLDLRCADLGKQLSDKADEKLLTDALAVLEEQGVYAFFLYLKARGKDAGTRVSDACRDFLKRTPEAKPLLGNAQKEIFTGLQTLAADLDGLLLARDLLRQALVYGRYHAKAATHAGGGG